MGRYGVNLGFVERPLIAGAIWGALSGDMGTALALAVFYELFWLDLFPAGTYMPPNQLFPMLCVFSVMAPLGSHGVASLFLPVILTLPLAFLGALLEKTQREWQVSGYNRVVLSLRTGLDMGGAARRSVFASLGQLFCLNFIVFFLFTVGVHFALAELAAHGFPLSFSHASWPLLWVIGCVGGLLGLRIRRNYVVFIIGSIGVALALLAHARP